MVQTSDGIRVTTEKVLHSERVRIGSNYNTSVQMEIVDRMEPQYQMINLELGINTALDVDNYSTVVFNAISKKDLLLISAMFARAAEFVE